MRKTAPNAKTPNKKSTPSKPGAKKQSAAPKKTPASAGKPAASKQAAAKRSPKKPAAQKKPDPRKPLFPRRTIAQRTVAFKTRNWKGIFSWIGIVFFSLLAVFFKFFAIGYSFSALVCLCLVGILLFYAVISLFSRKYPLGARRLKRIFTVILCIGLLVVGITEAIIIKASFGDPRAQCDYVVVLGAKVRPDGPSVSLMDRIYAARDYLNAHPDVVAIVSGGKGTDEPMTEAACIYQQLVRLGIDPQRIWMEEKATSTWENLNFSLNLIEEKTGSRPGKIGILSSEYHLFRASLFARECGVESVGIPAATSLISQRVNHFMREVAGVWHYILLGGQYE